MFKKEINTNKCNQIDWKCIFGMKLSEVNFVLYLLFPFLDNHTDYHFTDEDIVCFKRNDWVFVSERGIVSSNE